jgi:predicted DNA-binding transcriptional regulator YafY
MSADERVNAKWDRAARYLRIALLLHEHPEGMSAPEIAKAVGVSKRTIYRDLAAMDGDANLKVWQEGGRWGLASDTFLPSLHLTLHEATTLFLAARMLAKARDEHDTELIGAFVKLAQILPSGIGEHVAAIVDAYSTKPPDERFTRVFRVLAEAWASRRVVEIEYDTAVYDPARSSRRTSVRPWMIEPSALTHALYLIGWDEERRGRRTFKIERILSASLTPRTFEPDPAATPVKDLLMAWDVIADEEPVEVVIRFSAGVARRAAETRWHPSQVLAEQPDGALVWRGRVAGLREIRIWILGWGADAEVLEPASLRDDLAAELRRAADLYG